MFLLIFMVSAFSNFANVWFWKQGTPCSKMVSFLLKVISIMAAANSWCKNSPFDDLFWHILVDSLDSLDSMPWSPATGGYPKNPPRWRYPPISIAPDIHPPLLLLRILEGSLEPVGTQDTSHVLLGVWKFFLDPVGPKFRIPEINLSFWLLKSQSLHSHSIHVWCNCLHLPLK